MAIGSAIVLFVIGAILSFGVNVDEGGAFNINTIGYILMAGGAVGAILGMLRAGTGTKVQSTTTTQPTADGGTVRHTETQV